MTDLVNRDADKRGKTIDNVLAPCVIGAFFCFLLLFFGVGQYPDSATYIGYNTGREPLYPLFLTLCRKLAGETHFMWAAALLQNVFAFFAFWYLYCFFVRKFQLNRLFRIAALLVILAPHLMTSVFTPSGIVLTNAILSEGLTVSLYPLFVTLLLEAFYREKKGWFLAASYVSALLLSLARGQLMTMILVWFVVSAAAFVRSAFARKKESDRNASAKRLCGMLLVLLAATALGFVLRQAVMRTYHESMTGGVVHANTGGNITLLTNVLYSTDEQAIAAAKAELSERDAAYLQEIYERMREQGFCASDAGGGFHARILHHEDSHDKIKFDILYDLLSAGVWQEWYELPEGAKDGFEMSVDEDKMAGRLMKAVLPHEISDFLKTYLFVAAGGFVRTVALLSPLFSVYALLIYVVAAALMCYLFKREGSRDAAWLMAVVLLMIAANVCATALTIMCLSRYMIYNMTLFYLAGLVCVWEIVRVKK